MRVFCVILALFSDFRFTRVNMGGKGVEKLWVENLKYGWKKQKNSDNFCRSFCLVIQAGYGFQLLKFEKFQQGLHIANTKVSHSAFHILKSL